MTTTANWYHCSVKPISRSAGRSVVAAAAYRLGDSLYDQRTQTTHDYTRRGGVENTFILTPANAPEWATDPTQLWNAAEAAENRKNSRTAREIELALPSEVAKEDREQITRYFAQHLVERYGVAVMVALHEPSKHGDDRNYHAHILMTTRRMEADGLGQKTRELDDNTQGKAEVLHIREYAADLINAALEQTGSNERIDHRSFQDRGIDETPTEHVGVEASAMERLDEKSRKGERNREIKQRNKTLKALLEQSEELDRQIQQEEAQNQKRQQEREEHKEQQRAQAIKQQAEAKTEPEPKAKKAKTHWQDKIKAERETSSDNEGGGTTAAPLTTEQSQTPASPTVYHSPYSSLNNPVTIAHAQQIAKYGEIQHKGLIKSWVEHILDWTHELQGGVSDAWEILKEEAKGGGDYDLYDPRPESDAPATNRATVIAQTTEPEPPQAKGFWRRLIDKSTAPDSQQETTPQQENENAITPKDPVSPTDSPKTADSYDHDRDPWAQLMGETKAEFQRGKFTKAIESDKTPDKTQDNDRER